MKTAKTLLRTILKRHILAKMSRKSFFFFFLRAYIRIYIHAYARVIFCFSQKKKKNKKVPSRLAVLLWHFRQPCHVAELGKRANDVCCLCQSLQPHTLLGSRFLVRVFFELNQHVTLIRRDEKVIRYAFAAVFLKLATNPPVCPGVCSASTLKF